MSWTAEQFHEDQRRLTRKWLAGSELSPFWVSGESAACANVKLIQPTGAMSLSTQYLNRARFPGKPSPDFVGNPDLRCVGVVQ